MQEGKEKRKKKKDSGYAGKTYEVGMGNNSQTIEQQKSDNIQLY